MIQAANILLQTADSLKLTDQASLINIAEADWFRAYSYFDLIKNYGEIPHHQQREFTRLRMVRLQNHPCQLDMPR